MNKLITLRLRSLFKEPGENEKRLVWYLIALSDAGVISSETHVQLRLAGYNKEQRKTK